nr:MobF family relaxase [Kribbella sandramycini]
MRIHPFEGLGAMLSIHRMTAGDGYNYLLRHIASGDVDHRMATPLTAYYTATGYPPGRWLGTGLPGLGDGSLRPGNTVTEDQMAALFGQGKDPLNGRQLGRPYPVYKTPAQRVADQIQELPNSLSEVERAAVIAQIHKAARREETQQAVAGFDFTFSPVKSVSALWAIADIGTQEQIVAAHHDAVHAVVRLIEQHAAFSRTGEQGIAQIDTRGLVAAAFDHWDSRSGDPQLHTHVVVANRVQGKTDGAWRTLDSRVLHRATVAMSEIHNVLLADGLTRRLCVDWELRERGKQRNPAFEIETIPDELIREFSARTTQIETNLATLLDERGDALHPPSRREMYVLRQQATLLNRPPKEHTRPLSDLTSEWKKRAAQAVGSGVIEIIQRSLAHDEQRPLALTDLSAETVDAYGAATVLTLQNKRATWNRWNLLAETARHTRLLRFISPDERFAALQAIVQAAELHSISLTTADLVTTSATRENGESVFTIHNGQIYTSPVILGAEAVLLDLARDTIGPIIPRPAADLSDDKLKALHRIATSGQKVEAPIGPAGTGKTRLLAHLTTVWKAAHGEGSIIALAPSSAAATVLSDAIGSPSDNIAKWIYESVGLGAETRRQRIRETEYALQLANRARRKLRASRLTARLAALRAEHDRWHFHQDQLVIVDEASMAGTMELATLARATDAAGAKLLLVGDDAQLGAADTGGAFRLIAKDTNAAELSDVWRFTNPWERDASLALRTGSLSIIDTYDDHNRLTAGPSDDMETAAYQAWQTDTRAGRTSLLIAADNATVARLNARARLDRITTGEVEPDGIELHDGTHVGLGDHIVTRLNNRRLRYSPTGFVQNGDHWTVIHRWPDGSLTVQNNTDETVTLPTTYVQESVELAYATTAHRAQGATVDTAHLVVSDQLTRALLYVGMTRGRHTNHAYVATHQPSPDLHEPHFEQTMRDVLEAVLDNPGVELSAHEVMRQELDNATRLDHLIPIHEHLSQIDARSRFAGAVTSSGLDASDQAALQASPAYGALLAALRHAEATGHDVPALLRRAAHLTPLTDSHDIAAVLHTRVERLTHRSRRQEPVLIAGLVLPATQLADPTLVVSFRELESHIAARADWLAHQAGVDRPVWLSALQARPNPGLVSDLESIIRGICAYRERYGITAPNVLGTEPAAHQQIQLGHYKRLAAQIRPSSPLGAPVRQSSGVCNGRDIDPAEAPPPS